MTDVVGQPGTLRTKHGDRGECAECGEPRLIHPTALVLADDGLARAVARLEALLALQRRYSHETIAIQHQEITSLRGRVAQFEQQLAAATAPA